MRSKLWYRFRIAFAMALALAAGNVLAQAYPTKPIHVVVPYPAGGIIDMVARLVGQKLTEVWKQPVLIDNRGGAGGNIGADAVAKAAPDGYTLLMTTSALAIAPSLYRKLPFDAVKDFAPVSEICSTDLVLVATSKLPVESTKDLIALAKSKPGGLTYGHAGIGSPLHVTMEVWKKREAVNILSVPYKGSAPLSTALVTGEVDVGFIPPDMALSQVKAGKMRALAITSQARSPLLPDVPTITESGRELGVPGWYGLFAPAGTPREILDLMQREISKVLRMPDVQERITAVGPVVVASTPQEFEKKYKADIATFARIVGETRIPPQ